VMNYRSCQMTIVVHASRDAGHLAVRLALLLLAADLWLEHLVVQDLQTLAILHRQKADM
jgi:hypothetical protein